MWAHFAAGASFQNISPILPLITEEYGISHTTASLLMGVVMIISGAFGLPAGIIVGRLGLWRTYTAGWFMMGLLTLAALSPGFEGLLALRIAYGLGMAVMMPATGPLIMQWFRPKELPIITSVNVAVMSLGIVVSVSTAAPLSGIISWEKVLGLFGGIGLAGAFAWLLWGKAKEGVGDMAASFTWEEVRAVLRNRTILLLGLADASCFSMYIALSGWLPTFYNETRGMSLTEAGFIVGLLPFTGIFAVLLGGFLPLKMRSRRTFFIVPGVLAGVGALGSFLIDNTAITYASVTILGLGSWLYIPTLLTLPMELPEMTPKRVALAWGWIMTASGIGTFASPLVVGAMRDSLGTFVPGFLVFGAVAWFLVVAGFLLPKAGPRKAQLPGPEAPSTPIQE